MTKEDLMVFCSDNEHYPNIMRPFQEAGFTWATDGHILIRVPLIEDTPVFTDYKVSEFPDKYQSDNWLKIPEVEWHRKVCENCAGTGYIECPTCGISNIDCPLCNDGIIEPFQTRTLFGVRFHDKYLSLLNGLPNCEIGLRAPEEPQCYRFDGGIGFLMPCRNIE